MFLFCQIYPVVAFDWTTYSFIDLAKQEFKSNYSLTSIVHICCDYDIFNNCPSVAWEIRVGYSSQRRLFVLCQSDHWNSCTSCVRENSLFTWWISERGKTQTAKGSKHSNMIKKNMKITLFPIHSKPEKVLY